MTKTTPTVLVMQPQAEPLPLSVDTDDYHQMQALVGGVFTASTFEAGGVEYALFSHDEGLLVGLPPNAIAPSGSLLVGTVVFAGTNDDGDISPLEAADIERISAYVRTWQRIGRFEYDVPMPRFFTSFDEMRDAAPLPAVRIVGVDCVG